jgi:argininosuccinate synthase
MKKKVVLAFSGGLDTTYCAKYLQVDLGYDVHTLTVDTGGFTPAEAEAVARRAHALGVASHTHVDYTHMFYDRIIRYLIFGNVLKNGTYPLSVSAERMVQALATAEHARKLKADAVAHGSTGAGNDQVRFDMILSVLLPGTKIITPVRDQRLSRQEEVEYLKSHGIVLQTDAARYSINKGLWGTSVGGKETLQSLGMLPEEAWPTPVSRTDSEKIVVEFKQGEPVRINEQLFNHPVDAIRYLQQIAAPFGIGRDMHVGDTIIGIKGRVGFEAAAPILIIKSHHALEKHVLTKWQLYWKDQIAQFYGHWLHEGQYLDPVMRDMEAFLTSTQQRVSGEVHVELFPHHFRILGIRSSFDLMSADFGTYGEMNHTWMGEDVKGFTRIFGNQVAIYHRIGEKASKPAVL